MEASPPPQQSIFPKYLAAIIVLLIILLFPSQAPESLKKKIFPQLWELLRLFFIGLSICYGILCTRRIDGGVGGEDGAGDLDSEPYSLLDASISYFSGISNTSSIFEFSETVPVLNDDKPLGLPVRSLKSGLDGSSDWEIVVSSRNKLQSGMTDLAADNRGKEVRVSRLREEGGKVAAAPPPPPPALEYGSGDDEIVGEDRATFSRGSSNAWSWSGRTPLSSPSSDGLLRQGCSGRILSSEAMDLAEASVISDAPESRSSSEMNSQVEDEFNEEIMSMSHGMKKSPSHPLRSWSFWRPTPSETNPPAPPSPVSSPTASSSPNPAIVKVDDHPEEEAKVTISSATTKCPPEDSSSSSSSSSPLIDKKIQSLYSQGRTSGPRGVPRGKSVRTIRPRLLDESNSNASFSSSSRSLIDPFETLSSSLMTTTRKVVDESKSNPSASSSSRSLINPLETSSSSSMLMTTPRRRGVDEARPVPPPDFAGGGNGNNDILESRDDSASVWNESETSSDDGGKSGRSYFSDDMELGSEVDRKADEFIAKFKEQIRLQKGSN
ncbi:unnamed protein product [Cuscuta campestris]|uniref:Uncharacterized protein n=1 Tax=Cuscuta campestris TaxID=132261 RepID=A0A484MCG0_9ASTE|nr:unnamed protein product [Cuscuta campestris]